MVSFNKKAISPVVATALLLVVAVVAVVGFQTWFNTYQTGLTGQAESQSASSVSVVRLDSTGASTASVYFKSTGSAAVSVTKFQIWNGSGSPSSYDCQNTTTLTVPASGSGIAKGNFTGGCALTAGNSYKVVAYTNDGVFQETAIAR